MPHGVVAARQARAHLLPNGHWILKCALTGAGISKCVRHLRPSQARRSVPTPNLELVPESWRLRGADQGVPCPRWQVQAQASGPPFVETTESLAERAQISAHAIVALNLQVPSRPAPFAPCAPPDPANTPCARAAAPLLSHSQKPYLLSTIEPPSSCTRRTRSWPRRTTSRILDRHPVEDMASVTPKTECSVSQCLCRRPKAGGSALG